MWKYRDEYPFSRDYYDPPDLTSSESNKTLVRESLKKWLETYEFPSTEVAASLRETQRYAVEVKWDRCTIVFNVVVLDRYHYHHNNPHTSVSTCGGFTTLNCTRYFFDTVPLAQVLQEAEQHLRGLVNHAVLNECATA